MRPAIERQTTSERLARLGDAPAAQTERTLFQELNPDREYSQILNPSQLKPRPASVLIPVLQREDNYSVLLTVRSSNMPSHAGEISFPGGGPKGGDRSAVDTALRETDEEVGIPSASVDVLASLGPHVGGLGYVVTPVVGLVRKPPIIKPCDREVTEAFEVPLDFLINLENHTIIEKIFNGNPYRMFAVPYTDGGTERHIWGLTAGILHTLALAWHDRDISK